MMASPNIVRKLAQARSSGPIVPSWRLSGIGEGAYVGSGSVITKDVPDDALAVSRAPQEARDGWAAKLRTRRTRDKSK